MSLSVQTSFNLNKPIHELTMINCGNAVSNNFLYGVKQPVDYFSFIKSKNCLQNGYTAEQLDCILKHLANTPTVTPQPQETICVTNNTYIEEDVWDSIQW